MAFQHLSGMETASFAFLSARHILVTFFPPEPEGEGPPPTYELRSIIIDISMTSAQLQNVADVEPLCTFLYPALSEDAIPVSISVRSDPAPNWKPHPDIDVPFSVATRDRLFVVVLWIAQGVVHIFPMLFFIPSSTFLSHIDTLSPEDHGRSFQWETWGPTGTRLLPAPPAHTSTWVCYIYGMKFATVMRSRTQKVITVYDFNQLDFRRTMASGDYPEEEKSTFVTQLSGFRNGVFTQDVITSLPYRARRTDPFESEHGGDFDAVMIGEDSLITVSSVRVLFFFLPI